LTGEFHVEQEPNMKRQHVALNYCDAIKQSLWQQIPTIVFCTLLLDGGKILRVCLTSTLGFWLFAMIVLARSERFNEQQPNREGLLYLRWGYLPLFGVFLLLNNVVNR
jgi:hypothetical protein